MGVHELDALALDSQIENVISKGQGLGQALHQAIDMGTALVEHRLGQIDPYHLADFALELLTDQPGAAGDIQHQCIGSRRQMGKEPGQQPPVGAPAA